MTHVFKSARTPAYAAFGWSVIFIVPHVYWALGGDTGLQGQAPKGLLAGVNLAAIALSALAAALALALVRPFGQRFPEGLLLTGSWTAAVLLGLRGIIGLLQDLAIVLGAVDEDLALLTIVFDPLFLIGGILFGLAARDFSASRLTRVTFYR